MRRSPKISSYGLTKLKYRRKHDALPLPPLRSTPVAPSITGSSWP